MNNSWNALDNVFDLQIWFFLQMYYWPYYAIGKQDDWKDWVGSSLNGWRVSNLCKP
jgi:hypothetical protein